MPSYEHQELVKAICQLDRHPSDSADYATWIKAAEHLAVLKDNAREDELIIYASGPYMFIYAAVISEDSYSRLTKGDLLAWGDDPFSPLAGYSYEIGRPQVCIDRSYGSINQRQAVNATQIVFCRDFQRFSGEDGNYIEILQEVTHLANIHWRSEEKAYCRFDQGLCKV